MADTNAKQVNIEIDCGATFEMDIILRDDGGSPIDLTGVIATSHLREFPESNECMPFTCTHNNEGGTVTLSMNREDTAKISYVKGVYDVFLSFPNYKSEKILQGDVSIIPAVTR